MESLEIEKQIVYFKSSEQMNELSNDSIDVIVTSPPYNRGKKYSSDLEEEYNDLLPEGEYYGLLERVFSECLRVIKPTGVFFLNIGDSARDQGKSEKVAAIVEKVGFFRLQTIIWVKSLLGKGHYTPSGGSRRLNNLWESIFVLVKDRKKYLLDPKAVGMPYTDKSNIGRYSEKDLRDAGNVWLINYQKTTGKTIKKGHEAPFPIELPYRCIKLLPGAKLVLDPFAGTCSTLAAARSLGIKGVGYEPYARIDVIRQRIQESDSFQPQKQVLIPHLELGVKSLTKFLSETISSEDYRDLAPKTKKALTELKILNELLGNLGIKNQFSAKIEELLKDV